jgi:hypothetical protein
MQSDDYKNMGLIYKGAYSVYDADAPLEINPIFL